MEKKEVVFVNVRNWSVPHRTLTAKWSASEGTVAAIPWTFTGDDFIIVFNDWRSKGEMHITVVVDDEGVLWSTHDLLHVGASLAENLVGFKGEGVIFVACEGVPAGTEFKMKVK